MNNGPSSDSRAETLLYIIVLTIGISLVSLSVYQSSSFMQDLLLGLGSDMAVVTAVFLIFKLFGRMREKPTSSVLTEFATNYQDINAQLTDIKNEVSAIKREVYHVRGDRATTEKLLDTQTKILMSYTHATLDRIPGQMPVANPSHETEVEVTV